MQKQSPFSTNCISYRNSITNSQLNHIPKRKEQLEHQFVIHCARLIQANFRGYLQRKRYRQFLPIYRRINELFTAALKGWKVRNVFKLKLVSEKVRKIKQLEKSQMHCRITKRELAADIDRYYQNGRWVQQKHKEKSNTQSCHNNGLMKSFSKVNLKKLLSGKDRFERKGNSIGIQTQNENLQILSNQGNEREINQMDSNGSSNYCQEESPIKKQPKKLKNGMKNSKIKQNFTSVKSVENRKVKGEKTMQINQSIESKLRNRQGGNMQMSPLQLRNIEPSQSLICHYTEQPSRRSGIKLSVGMKESKNKEGHCDIYNLMGIYHSKYNAKKQRVEQKITKYY